MSIIFLFTKIWSDTPFVKKSSIFTHTFSKPLKKTAKHSQKQEHNPIRHRQHTVKQAPKPLKQHRLHKEPNFDHPLHSKKKKTKPYCKFQINGQISKQIDQKICGSLPFVEEKKILRRTREKGDQSRRRRRKRSRTCWPWALSTTADSSLVPQFPIFASTTAAGLYFARLLPRPPPSHSSLPSAVSVASSAARLRRAPAAVAGEDGLGVGYGFGFIF